MAKGMVQIEASRCKGCGLCVTVCPPAILALPEGRLNDKGYPPIEVSDMQLCTGCSVCAIVCPDVVFTVYRQKRVPRSKASAGQS